MFIFDLDRTIWNCYDKNGNKIWAKQMIFPYSISDDDNLIIDDVGSICVLDKYYKEYLHFLSKNRNNVGFLSNGAILDLNYKKQPSIMLLKKFKIYSYYNNIKIIQYKNKSKKEILEKYHEKITYFDDDDDILNSLKELKNITTIDRKTFLSWKEFLHDSENY
jgi:hypothetical protein